MKWLDKLLKNPPHWREFKAAKANFVYVKDEYNEAIRYSSIYHIFEGDCEDFAFTLQKAFGGGDVVYASVDKVGHAVLLKDGWVYCNLCSKPYKLADYTAGTVFPEIKLLFNSMPVRWEIDNEGRK
ncbi:MAG: hypothetical protein CMK07_13460 [Ponticaulis sp.]|nr:hypothetical protein [Ponticaulis sp.]|tara:strand:+ start:8687 stop:9064 length:378 start_codon:yes stop_codon:yes gene_type:complete